MESSSSSTLSNSPSYPGLHSVAPLQPKSPGSHSARDDAATWYAWQSEIRELVDFLLTETPPSPAALPKRTSRELLRSGSKHLRQSLRGRPLRNTWGSRQLRTLMGKPEQRFCHIIQDPEFLKDMSDPGMYLINCNARALGKGFQEQQSKSSLDWKAMRISDESKEAEPEATLDDVPGTPRVPRVLSKRLPLNSHPSRGRKTSARADKNQIRRTQSTHVTSTPAPRAQGAISTSLEVEKTLPEVPTTAFDPFDITLPDPPKIHRKPIRADAPSATPKLEINPAGISANIRKATSRDHLSVGTPTEPATDITPASSIVHLPPVPPPLSVAALRQQRSFPIAGTQDSPTSSGTAPFLSHKGSYEDAFRTSRKKRSEEPLTAPNKPWLESGLASNQPWRLRETSSVGMPPTRIPAPYFPPVSTSSNVASESDASSYAATQNIWSANAALARRRMASRIDTTRRLKQRDFERARAVRLRKASDASSGCDAEKRVASSSSLADLKPPGTSHSAHSEPMARWNITSLPQPRTMRLQRAISYDGHEESEPATSRALDWYAKSPTNQGNPWNKAPDKTSRAEPAARHALSPVVTVAESVPAPSQIRPPSRMRSNARRTTYRSQGTQCRMDSGADTDTNTSLNRRKAGKGDDALTHAVNAADGRAPPDLSRLETKLDAQLAHMDQRTRALESLLLTFVRKAASRDALGWDTLSKAARGAEAPDGVGVLGPLHEAGIV